MPHYLAPHLSCPVPTAHLCVCGGVGGGAGGEREACGASSALTSPTRVSGEAGTAPSNAVSDVSGSCSRASQLPAAAPVSPAQAFAGSCGQNTPKRNVTPLNRPEVCHVFKTVSGHLRLAYPPCLPQHRAPGPGMHVCAGERVCMQVRG